MDKTFKRLFIIVFIALIIYIMLVYTDIGRKIYLKTVPVRHLAESYNNLNRVDTKDPVIVCMSMSSKAKHDIKTMIKAVLDQTKKVDQIGVNIPCDVKNSCPSEVELVANVFKCGRNYNSGNSLIPTLLRTRENNMYIISICDGKILKQDAIEKLINASIQNPDSSIILGKNLSDYDALLVKPKMVSAEISEDPTCLFDSEWISNNITASQVLIN